MSSNISGYRYWWQGVSGKGGDDDDGGSDDDDGDGDGDSDDSVEEREVAAS